MGSLQRLVPESLSCHSQARAVGSKILVAFQCLKEPRELPFESDGWKNCTQGDGAQAKQAAEGRVLSLEEEETTFLAPGAGQASKLGITGSATTETVCAEGYPDPQAITDWSVPLGASHCLAESEPLELAAWWVMENRCVPRTSRCAFFSRALVLARWFDCCPTHLCWERDLAWSLPTETLSCQEQELAAAFVCPACNPAAGTLLRAVGVPPCGT